MRRVFLVGKRDTVGGKGLGDNGAASAMLDRSRTSAILPQARIILRVGQFDSA